MTVPKRVSESKIRKRAIFQQIEDTKAWLNGLATTVRTTTKEEDEAISRGLELIAYQVKMLRTRLLTTGNMVIPELDRESCVSDTSSIKRVDDLGRVVIPKEIRRHLNISEGTPMNVYLSSKNEIVFRKYVQVCEEELVQNLHKVIEDMEKSDRINNHCAVMELLNKAMELIQEGVQDE